VWKLVNLGLSGSGVVGNDIAGTNDSCISWYDNMKDKICYADILTIMLGTNDAGNNWERRAPLFDSKYGKIIEDFKKINPYLELYIITPINSYRETYATYIPNGIISSLKKLATNFSGTLIDTYTPTKTKMDAEGESSIIEDNDIALGIRLHPDEEGHKFIAKTVAAAMTARITPVTTSNFETTMIKQEDNILYKLKESYDYTTNDQGSDVGKFDYIINGELPCISTEGWKNDGYFPSNSEDKAIYIDFDMKQNYLFKSFMFAGAGNGYGAHTDYSNNALELYIDSQEIDMDNPPPPVWSYSKNITTDAIRIDFDIPITGRYVTIGVGKKKQYNQVWIGELALVGGIALAYSGLNSTDGKPGALS
jgi:lysophospholipase L1-like esterase